MDIVEKGTYATCKEQKALVKRVRWCFEHEAIYVDEEQLEKYLGLAKYFPFDEVFPWQKFVIALHDCTYWKDTGMPRWPDLFCMIGRGAGKDGTIALESTCLMSPYNGIQEYDVDICANNEDQAMRPVQDVINAFEEPAVIKKLKKFFYWTKEVVKCIKTKSVMRGRTNSPKGKDGLRSGIVVFNEIHQYEDYKNIDVFTTGLGKKKHPRRSYYTTNGNVREGPLDDLLETSEGILFGDDPDNGLLPFICRLDSKDEVDDEANWPKANPSLPYLPHLLEEIRKEYREWKKNPRRLPAFMTKRMNIPENAEETPVTDWENIKATNIALPDLERWSCTCGIDFSKITDWASVNLHFRDGDLRYDISHSWLCLKSRDIPRMKCPWREWAKEGRLTLVDDVEIHPSLLTEYIQQAKRKYTIKMLAIDDFRFALLSKYLQDIGFDTKVNKNLKMVRPSDIMKVATVIDSCFANQWFRWGDAPELRWATNNTKMIRSGRKPGKEDDADMGNYVYGKIEGKSRKTDPFMALVASMVVEDVLPQHKPKPTPKIQVYSY
ncbi:MAG TPA: terminase large subunit [Candidatus Scybalocola faecavium]|nr:terminase large subunit [Candidatus Scybalocola faecavium]